MKKIIGFMLALFLSSIYAMAVPSSTTIPNILTPGTAVTNLGYIDVINI